MSDRRQYVVHTCPVPVADMGYYIECGAECSLLIEVDGVEYYGDSIVLNLPIVSVIDAPIVPRCGHTLRDIARAERDFWCAEALALEAGR